MNTTKTTPAKRGRAKAAPAAPAAPADDTAARRAAAMTALGEAEAALKALKAAVRGGNADAVRAAADDLAGAAQGTRRLCSARKSGGPVGPRTPKGEGRYQAMSADGTVLAQSNYRASTARDIAMARKRIRDDVAREGDAALASSTLVDTEAVTP
jgi:hypothetical protein